MKSLAFLGQGAEEPEDRKAAIMPTHTCTHTMVEGLWVRVTLRWDNFSKASGAQDWARKQKKRKTGEGCELGECQEGLRRISEESVSLPTSIWVPDLSVPNPQHWVEPALFASLLFPLPGAHFGEEAPGYSPHHPVCWSSWAWTLLSSLGLSRADAQGLIPSSSFAFQDLLCLLGWGREAQRSR